MHALNIIKYPTGRYGYAGRVPVDLAYRITGGNVRDRHTVRQAITQSGPGIARRIAERTGVVMEAKSFDTPAEAFDVASAFVDAHGITITIHAWEAR